LQTSFENFTIEPIYAWKIQNSTIFIGIIVRASPLGFLSRSLPTGPGVAVSDTQMLLSCPQIKACQMEKEKLERQLKQVC